MKMHQPAYAHSATNLLLFNLVFFAVPLFFSAWQRRRITDTAELSKHRTEQLWRYFIYWATMVGIIAPLYSAAFDLPHAVSPRTLSLAYCGLIGPSLPFLRMWIDKKSKQRAAKEQSKQERPYYITNQQKQRNSRHT